MSEEEDHICPNCQSRFGYRTGEEDFMCPECGHEWRWEDATEEDFDEETEDTIKDSVGNVLHDGDAVMVVKDLPVKGYSKPLKAGTKVKNIKLVKGNHNISCKISGYGAMGLKSEFVKKI